MKLHLGSGLCFMSGWLNIDLVDASGPEFCKHDLTTGLPKHIHNNSVDFIFTQHFLEHITREQAVLLLLDCRRKLKPGGVIRIVVPDLDECVQRYVTNQVPNDPGGWGPPNRCIMINQAFHAWGHKFLYNKEELEIVVREAGFTNISWPAYKDSAHAALQNIDVRPSTDLRVEATK